VRYLPTLRGTSSLPFFGFLQAVGLWPSLFVSPGMVLAIDLLLDFCELNILYTKKGLLDRYAFKSGLGASALLLGL
jgi:hypothetical protein